MHTNALLLKDSWVVKQIKNRGHPRLDIKCIQVFYCACRYPGRLYIKKNIWTFGGLVSVILTPVYNASPRARRKQVDMTCVIMQYVWDSMSGHSLLNTQTWKSEVVTVKLDISQQCSFCINLLAFLLTINSINYRTCQEK